MSLPAFVLGFIVAFAAVNVIAYAQGYLGEMHRRGRNWRGDPR